MDRTGRRRLPMPDGVGSALRLRWIAESIAARRRTVHGKLSFDIGQHTRCRPLAYPRDAGVRTDSWLRLCRRPVGAAIAHPPIGRVARRLQFGSRGGPAGARRRNDFAGAWIEALAVRLA